MATRVIFRSLISTANQTLISRISTTATPSSILRIRPLVAAAVSLRHAAYVATKIRAFSTRQTTSSLNDSNPNWSNRPPKETILLDGCDFEHWLVVVEKPEGWWRKLPLGQERSKDRTKASTNTPILRVQWTRSPQLPSLLLWLVLACFSLLSLTVLSRFVLQALTSFGNELF